MINQYKEKLNENGLKNTPQRLAILDIIANEKQPLSAEEILSKLNISVNLSTIYRTLDTMAQKNIISKLEIDGVDRCVYEYNREGHRHYLICKGCKKIVAIYGCPLATYEKSLEQKTEYKIDEHKLFIYGYCPDCNRNKQN